MEQSNFSSDGSMPGSTQGQTSSSDRATADSGTQQSQGITDRARDLAGNAQEKLADVGSTVRDRAGSMKDSLADALESGAEKLRTRGTSGGAQLATTTGVTTGAAASDDRVAQLTTRVAGGMDATADWLRDADLDGMKTSIERQVKEHPGRTLLIAAGLGYLLGKALKK